MSSDAVASQGTEFRYWDTSTWVKLAEVTDISGPDKSRETIDVTTLDSQDGYREFIGSFRDGGTVTLAMNFTRATYDVINSHFESDVVQNYEIVLPDSDTTSFEFEGLVTELGIGEVVGDKITQDVTIKISGKTETNSGSGPSVGA